MADLLDYLQTAKNEGASDIFIVAGGPVSMKKDGKLTPILGDERIFADGTERLVRDIYQAAKRDIETYLSHGDDDFSFSVPQLARFRVNTYRQRGSMAAVIRIVAFDIPSWKDLSIPEEVMNLADTADGMILVTGVAGSGKSTTQACLIDRINHSRQAHIITLEDPIEYLHRDAKSIISQREISIDTKNYPSALRACLRQAPDVILLGEMRDPETIHTAITAAETGHLIIATLHTKGVADTIDRILDAFPGSQQDQVRTQLSRVLQAVVSQELLPTEGGHVVPVFEVMRMTTAISSMILHGEAGKIDNELGTSESEARGMMSKDRCIQRLYEGGKLSKEAALNAVSNQRQFLNRVGN